jgi:hypothetical protein
LSLLRDRFRAWLDSGDRRWVLPSIAGAGLAQISSQFVAMFTQARDDAMKLPQAGFIGMLVLFPFLAIGFTWINALLLRWTGRWLKGVATTREIFVAHGWALAPVALCSPLVAAEALALIRGAADPDQVEGLPSIASLIVGSALLYTSVLAVVRFFISISEVQKFSKLKVLGNLLLSVGIGLAVMGALALIFWRFLSAS